MRVELRMRHTTGSAQLCKTQEGDFITSPPFLLLIHSSCCISIFFSSFTNNCFSQEAEMRETAV